MMEEGGLRKWREFEDTGLKEFQEYGIQIVKGNMNIVLVGGMF